MRIPKRARVRGTLWGAAIPLVLSLLLSDTASAQALRQPPSVLLIVVDTLRADRLEATRNGVPVMPRLRAFAQESTCFTQAYAPASWTKPSMVSILTSLYPGTHGVRFTSIGPRRDRRKPGIADCIPEAEETAPLFFQRNGYSTAVIQTNEHLRGTYGFAQGCDSYEMDSWEKANVVSERARTNMGSMRMPFFVYAHFFDPHAPYLPPEEHLQAFGPLPQLQPGDERFFSTQSGVLSGPMEFKRRRAAAESQVPAKTMSAEGRELVRAYYDAECHFADAEIGKLIDYTREKFPRTVIAVCADHGEEFWEHGGIGHVRTVYNELVHVPFLLHVPGAAPRVVDGPVSTLDMMPVLAAAAGLRARATWQGRDATRLSLAPRPEFSETRGTNPAKMLLLESVVYRGFKLIREQACPSELYDLAADTGEKLNLIDALPELRDELDSQLDAHNATMSRHPMAHLAPVVQQLNPEIQEQLSALGYGAH